MNIEFESKLFEEIKLLEQGKQEAIKEIKKEVIKNQETFEPIFSIDWESLEKD
ncbi:MAG: hypothetical protein ACRC15_02275 [Cetobacterium sp.]|uniref:hypothetical protein n=1 Tax=Cetobacterium sp. TaxID=2071632 RepID=UPI003EE721E2